MMNAGKILIGTAMLLFSLALWVSPSGATPCAATIPDIQGQTGFTVLLCMGMDGELPQGTGAAGQGSASGNAGDFLTGTASTVTTTPFPFPEGSCLPSCRAAHPATESHHGEY
jgi:hypothetical protein